MPSTSTPQDAYKILGHWHCTICGATGKGGIHQVEAHYLREHYQPPKRNPLGHDEYPEEQS
jgi:ribosomal protein L37AE/L43A